MARVVRTREAEESIYAIGRRIAQQSCSLEAALQFLDRIDEKCGRYARQPEMGDLRPDIGENVRCFPVGNYVVLYRPHQDGILVLLVVHGARDIPTVFRQAFRR